MTTFDCDHNAPHSDAAPTTLASHTVRGACPHDCPDTCALLTTVASTALGGIAIKVQGNPAHAQTDGVLCTKVSRYAERTHHPDRLLYPMRRNGPKGSAQFTRISWDEALDTIALRLSAIAERDPQAIQPYSYAGTMGLVQGEAMAGRFFNQLGAARLDRTICASAGAEGLRHTLGGKLGMRVEQFAHAKLIVIWGSNSIGSNLHFWRYAMAAKRAGARLVCIDPRRTETADKCHTHLAVRPGTDAALALALMHEWVTHDWLDHAYIQAHTVGFGMLRERCLLWNPERAAAICGIDAQAIRDLARDFAQTALSGQGAAIRLNYGMQRARGGGNATRAVACLPALVGAWRVPSGGLLMSSSGEYPTNTAALQRPDLLAAHPEATRQPRTVNMVTIGDDLLRPASPEFGPRIEAMLVYNSNPVAVAPQSGQVVAGFAREDLFTVVLEQFQTDTADYADILLPATTQLEHWDIHTSYGHTDVLLNRPAIAPVGEAKPNSQIWRELAARMASVGGNPRFLDPCFADDDETLCRQAFGPGSGVDFEALLRDGFCTLPRADAPFANGNFATPSGKCEFFSQRLADAGMDGLPDYLPNYEAIHSGAAPAYPSCRDVDLDSTVSRATPYPLAMISPPARNFLNSSFVNVTSLRDIESEPVLEIHPVDAVARGIASGDVVRVFNDRGTYHCAARVSDRARPGVVNGMGIWWRKLGLRGTNVNELTSQRLTDLGRAPVFYDCLVEVALDVALDVAPDVAPDAPSKSPHRATAEI